MNDAGSETGKRSPLVFVGVFLLVVLVIGAAFSILTSMSPFAGRNLPPISISSVKTADILVGGSPRTIAVNPNASRIYVADWFSSNLTVVDTLTHSVVATVVLPASSNNGIAIDYDSGTVYVLVEGGVAIVNGSTDKVVGELRLGFGPGALAYDSATHILYGSEGGLVLNDTTGGSLVGVDVRTGSVVANISLGYWADSIAVDSNTHMVYAVGCAGSFVCGSHASVINGSSETLLDTVNIGSWGYPRVAVDPKTDVAYVTGVTQLVALNGRSGKVIFNSNSLVCGPFDSVAIIPSSNQVLAITLNSDYVFVYDGATGALVNMYSWTAEPQYIAFNPNAGELYVTLFSGHLLAFQDVTQTGHINDTLIHSSPFCGFP